MASGRTAEGVEAALGSAALYEPGDELETVLSELGASPEMMVRVYRIPESGPNRRPQFATKYPLASFDPTVVSETYGPGTYQFQFTDTRGKIKKAVTQTFIAPVAQAAPTAAPVDRHAAFLEQMVLALLARPAAPAGGSGEIIEAFRLGLTASKPAEAPNGPTWLDALRMGVELTRHGTRATLGMADDGDEDRGSPRSSGGMMLETLAPRILALIERGISRGDGHAPAAAPVAAPASSPAALPPTVEADPLVSMLRMYAPTILEEAASGRDAEEWGAFVAERTPDAWVPVLDRLTGADPEQRFQFLCTIEPKLASYREWIDAACRGMMYEDDGEEDAAGLDVPAVPSQG